MLQTGCEFVKIVDEGIAMFKIDAQGGLKERKTQRNTNKHPRKCLLNGITTRHS